MSDEGCVPAIPGMAFVIRVPEKDKWLKSEDGKDCIALFREPPAKSAWKGGWQEQALHRELLSSYCLWPRGEPHHGI